MANKYFAVSENTYEMVFGGEKCVTKKHTYNL